jgi:hypothetical protein
MEPSGSERVGVLVIQAWLEGDDPRFFRARVRSSSDVERQPDRSESCAAPADVLAAVQRWLSGFQRRDTEVGGHPSSGSDS